MGREVTIPPEPMTLTELLATYRGLFYTNNSDWYRGERFMRALPNERTPTSPHRVVPIKAVPKSTKRCPLAVDVANAYVRDPVNPIWDDYILCRDRDASGQPVFVGGCANGKGFEIHRVVDHSQRLRIPVWK